jgi:hypothetical protein
VLGFRKSATAMMLLPTGIKGSGLRTKPLILSIFFAIINYLSVVGFEVLTAVAMLEHNLFLL